MKIDLTKDEYRNLIDMLYIADWIITSYKTEIDPELEKYQQLRNKFYAHAEKMGMENLVKYDEELKNYYETAEFENESACHELINEYDNKQFWDRLIEDLTMRDLHAEVDVRKIKENDSDAYFDRYEAIEKKYIREFEKNGIENLILKAARAIRTH